MTHLEYSVHLFLFVLLAAFVLHFAFVLFFFGNRALRKSLISNLRQFPCYQISVSVTCVLPKKVADNF